MATVVWLLERVRFGRVFVYHRDLQPAVAQIVSKLEAAVASKSAPARTNIRAYQKHRTQFSHMHVYELSVDITDYQHTVTRPRSRVSARRVFVRRDDFQRAISTLVHSSTWRTGVKRVSDIPPSMWTSICAVLLPCDISRIFPNLQPWSLVDSMLYRTFSNVHNNNNNDDDDLTPGAIDVDELDDSNSSSIPDDNDSDAVAAAIRANSNIATDKHSLTYVVNQYQLSGTSVALLVFTITFEYYLRCVSNALMNAPIEVNSLESAADMMVVDSQLFNIKHVNEASAASLFAINSTNLFEPLDTHHAQQQQPQTSASTDVLNTPMDDSSSGGDDDDENLTNDHLQAPGSDTDDSLGSDDTTGEHSSFSPFVEPAVLSILDEYELVNANNNSSSSSSQRLLQPNSRARPSDIDSQTLTRLYHCGRFVLNHYLRSTRDLVSQHELWTPSSAFQAYQFHCTRYGTLNNTFQTIIAPDITINYVSYLEWLQRRLRDYTSKNGGIALEAFSGNNDAQYLVARQMIPRTRHSMQALRHMQLFTHGFVADRDVNALGVALKSGAEQHAVIIFDRTQVSPLRLFATMRLFDILCQTLMPASHGLQFCIAFDTQTSRVSMPMSKYAVLKYQLVPYYLSQPNRVERLVPMPMFHVQWRQWFHASNPLSQSLAWLCGVRTIASLIRRRANIWHNANGTVALPIHDTDPVLPYLAQLPLIMRHYVSDANIWNALVQPLQEASTRRDDVVEIFKRQAAVYLDDQNCLLTALDAFANVYCVHYIESDAFEMLAQYKFTKQTPLALRVGELLDAIALHSSAIENVLLGRDGITRYFAIPYREHDDVLVPWHICLYELCASNILESAVAVQMFCSIRIAPVRNKHVTLAIHDNSTYETSTRRLKRHRLRALQLYHDLRNEGSQLPYHDASASLPLNAVSSEVLEAGREALFSLMRSLHVLVHYPIQSSVVLDKLPTGPNTMYTHRQLLDELNMVLLTPEESVSSRLADCIDIRETKHVSPDSLKGRKKPPPTSTLHPLTVDNALPLVCEDYYESLTPHYHWSGVRERGERAYTNSFYERSLRETVSLPFTFSPPDVLPLLVMYPIHNPLIS